MDEIGILKWPVIFTPLFFMATLEMDPGGYDDPFFFEIILKKVENYNFIPNYLFSAPVIITPPRILMG